MRLLILLIVLATLAGAVPSTGAAAKPGKPSARYALPPGKDIFESIRTGDFAQLQRFTRAGLAIGSTIDPEYNTSLHVAAMACDLAPKVRERLVRLLIANGGAIETRNTSGESAAMIAESKCGGPPGVVALLTAGRSDLLAPGPTSMPKESQALRFRDRGYGLLNSGDPQRALEAFQQAIQLNPSHSAFYMGAGFALERLENFSQAEVEFRAALKLDPENPTAKAAVNRASQHAAVAAAREAQLRQAEAARQQRAAQQAQVAAVLQRAEQLRLSGALQDAINVYEQARQMDSANPAALNGQGLAYQQLRKHALAEWAFKTALQYDPNNAQIRANLDAAQQAIANHNRQFQQTYQQAMQERSAAATNDAQAMSDAITGLATAIVANRAAQQQAAQLRAQQAQQAAAQAAAAQAQQARERDALRQQQYQQQQLQLQVERNAQQRLAQERQAAQRAQESAAAQVGRTIPYSESLAAQQQRNLEAQRIAQQQSAQKVMPSSNFSPPPPEPRGLVLGPSCQGLPAGARNCGFAGPDTVDREKLAREKQEFNERMKREDAEKRAQQAEINRKLQQESQRNIDQATAYRNEINAKNERIRLEREQYVNSQASRSDAVGSVVVSVNNCATVRFHNRTDINLSLTYYFKATIGGKEARSGSWTSWVGPKGTNDSQVPGLPCDENVRVDVYEVRWQATRDNYYTYSPI